MDSPISPQLKRHLLLNCWVLQERLDAATENGCEIKKGLLSSWKDTVSPAFPEKFNNRNSAA